MANNYTEGAAILKIPEGSEEKVQKIIDQEMAFLEANDDSCNIEVSIEPEGVWFRHDSRSLTPDHAEHIAREIIDALEIDEPFFFSWAYTCDKARPEEFGGGAFCIKRGYHTEWCDALNHVMHQHNQKLLEPIELD